MGVARGGRRHRGGGNPPRRGRGPGPRVRRAWTKPGPAFAGTPYAMRSSKSGAIVTEVVDGRVLAARVDGRFWMYWGEGTCFAAASDDLVRWSPVEFDATRDRYLTYNEESEQP